MEGNSGEWDSIIQKMRECGWTAHHEDPMVIGPDRAPRSVIRGPMGQEFPSWLDAVMACIEVASEA
jgi:hypothetical protein